ncbi:Double zinc ribbon [Ruminococcaceae bacterium YRB3002]|nr:Double zinc ribbon [Ruminococcaceae bacterium YRB3002]
MIRCPQCGTKNKEDSRYCEDCGATLKKDSTVNLYDEPVDAPLYKTDPETFKSDADSPEVNKKDILCISALIISIFNMAGCGLLSIPGLIFAVYAYNKAKKENLKGERLALVAVILSGLSILYFVFMVFAVLTENNA